MENRFPEIPDNASRLTGALRDFFIARNAAEMRVALTLLPMDEPSGWPSREPADAPGAVAGDAVCADCTDWDQAEFAFNRLFVGPMALEAPPYASIYLEDEPQVMGRTTMLVRSVYEMVGLVSPWKNTLPDDHVSLELDAALALHRLLQAAPPSVRGQVEELRGFFLEEHVQVWMPRFCARIETAPSATPVLLRVAAALRQWLGSSIAGHKSPVASWTIWNKEENT